MSSSKMWANRASVRSAFVIQFGEGAEPFAKAQNGTVEHVASGERQRFSSWDELQSFVAGVLAAGTDSTECGKDEEDR